MIQMPESLTILIQWGPWIVAATLAGITGYINTKLESLRLELAQRGECDKHLHGEAERLRTELEEWKRTSSNAHVSMASDVAHLRGSIDSLLTMVRDMSLDIKQLLPRMAIIETRVDNNEKMLRRIHLLEDGSEDYKP